MTERWICSRCFTSADPGVTVCPNCGLARGAPPELAAGEAAASGESAVSAPMQTSVPAAGWRPEERWVCQRCFTSNNGTDGECVKCGLARGAEVAPADQAAWAGTAAAPVSTGRRQIPWFRLGIYALIAAVVLGGTFLFAARRDDSGQITGAGDLSVFDLQVGDCFDVSAGESEVTSVRAIPCGEPHVYEVYWNGDYPGDSFPSTATADSWAEGQCIPAFEDYVDFGYEESIYYVSYLSPSEESWADGDRVFTCYLHNVSETPISGSARGAGQ